MLEEIYNYFTIEMLYYWVNLGVLPFWFILIFFPRSNLTKYFVTTIFPILILNSSRDVITDGFYAQYRIDPPRINKHILKN